MQSHDPLRQIHPAIATDKLPAAKRAALRAWKQQHPESYQIVVFEILGVNQMVNALPGDAPVVNWRLGSVYKGLYIEAQTLLPAEDDPPPEPRARTMTEKAARRDRKNPATT